MGITEKIHVPLSTSSYPVSAADVGILKSTLLPSFCLHLGLSTATYGISRATDRVEGKDWLWPSGQVINAWWNAVGWRMYRDGLSLPDALKSLSWSEKLLLSGVTAWGLHLFYHIVSRSLKRGKGRDDPRYEQAKKQQPGFWNKAFFSLFLPEVLFQTVISLPFTVPFRVLHGAVPLALGHATAVRALAVGLFTAGFTLETLADAQVAAYREQRSDLCTEGVWSIVRHPK
jgi:steroid 5-alpha reductase family enzyme